MTMPVTPRHILVTGASGGLGTALARHYARPGVHLSLWGRDELRLSALAEVCREAGAAVRVRSLDLVDLSAALAALADEDAADPIDLAIFASGLGDIRAPGDKVEDAALVARLGLVNFVAPTTLAAALAARMAERGTGGIVLVGSAAGFHALPFAAAYSGTKAGLAHFAEALRLGVRKHGVAVTLVSPGFIDTAAGRKVPGPKPLLMQPAAVAARIARAAERGEAHAIMPWPFVVLRWLDRLLPRPLRERLLLGLAPPA
jgi:short-subunit dehydrogenase